MMTLISELVIQSITMFTQAHIHNISLLILMERTMGIEPTSSAWKAEVIAIIRRPHLVLREGLEPSPN